MEEAGRPSSKGTEGKKQEASSRLRRWFLGVWTMVGAIVLTVVVVYLLKVLSVPVGVVIFAIIIVFCLRGPVNKLEQLGVSRGIGTALAFLLMIVVLTLAGILLFSPAFGLGGQFTNLVESIPGYAQEIAAWANSLYSQYSDFFEDDTVRRWLNDALEEVGVWATSFAQNGAVGVVAIGAGVMNSFVVIGFGFVVAFWILMELPALGRECRRLVGPRRQTDMDMLHVTFTRVMGGYIKGTLLQCLVIGVGCGICFAIVGIPNYAALGGIAGLLNIIPIVGPWLGGALAAMVGVFVSPVAALVALVGTIAIQQVVYTFVSPKIMASSVDVHPALTMIALLAGSAIGGAMNGFGGSILGMLASIPAVAVAKAVFVYYFERRTGRQLVAADGVFFRGTPSAGEGVDPILDATSPHPDATAALERIEQRKADLAERAERRRKRKRKP